MEIREGHNKFYINDKQGKQIAEIVFVPTGENLAIIEHTDVDESLKGQGIGKQLVAKVVEKMQYAKATINFTLMTNRASKSLKLSLCRPERI